MRKPEMCLEIIEGEDLTRPKPDGLPEWAVELFDWLTVYLYMYMYSLYSFNLLLVVHTNLYNINFIMLLEIMKYNMQVNAL